MVAPPTLEASAAIVAAGLPGELVLVWAFGLVAGLVLFVRGLFAYRLRTRVATIASSSVAGIAAGEVRITGTVEPGSTILVSPLQSRRCVHYHAHVSVERGRSRHVLLDESRSVSFQLRDASGVITVLPRDAAWELPPRLDAWSGLGDAPASVNLNRGPAEEFGLEDRDAQIARLLTVQGPSDHDSTLFERTMGLGPGGEPTAASLLAGSLGAGLQGPMGGGPHYVEARVEPGDTITIVGTAVPFSQVGDRAGSADDDPIDDPEVAVDLAAARASGMLASGPDDAWGNAAIPGFGIGRPERTPQLDPEATPEPAVPPPLRPDSPSGPGRHPSGPVVATDELVLAAGSTPMTIFTGTPVEAAGAEMSRFWLGLGGAVLAVACAALLVAQLGLG